MVYIVMLLYLVEPESSRILCCKVYKRIGVVFRWFSSQECCENNLVSQCLLKCDEGGV